MINMIQCFRLDEKLNSPSFSTFFDAFWKRKSLLSLYLFTAVECHLNREHTLCHSRWFHSDFCGYICTCHIALTQNVNDTQEYDAPFFLLSYFEKLWLSAGRDGPIFHIKLTGLIKMRVFLIPFQSYQYFIV